MRLAKLTLTGFKSFADRTEFSFDAPITGIVGPNGCGKSNVVDAIKWVLGERSAKSLRGSSMGDVIFAGSAGRKPGGLASVTLTFDNPVLERAIDPASAEPVADPASDEPVDPAAPDERSPLMRGRRNRALPIDAETVDVERRLHRDGTSEYLINGRKARLKDIRDLFLDTGIGADAYSIIEQGKVDAMLLANAVDRRVFFEEAAGVAKFRVRRVEAERKLDRAETNLVRVREQLESTDRRLRIVKGQAAKARLFQELDEKLRALRTGLALHQYRELKDRLSGLTSRITGLERERSEATGVLEAAEADKQQAELERHAALQARQDAERRRASAQHAMQSAEQRRAMTERTLAESRQQLEDEKSQGAALRERTERLTADRDAHTARIAELEGVAADAERSVREAADARETAQRALGELEAALSAREPAARARAPPRAAGGRGPPRGARGARRPRPPPPPGPGGARDRRPSARASSPPGRSPASATRSPTRPRPSAGASRPWASRPDGPARPSTRSTRRTSSPSNRCASTRRRPPRRAGPRPTPSRDCPNSTSAPRASPATSAPSPKNSRSASARSLASTGVAPRCRR